MIRNVQLKDSSALTDLYNFYIRTSGATFEETEISEDEMSERITKIHFEKHFPYIVFEEDSKIIGYAYVTSFRDRISYRFTVESTVYVHPDHFGKGIGHILYKELLSLTKAKGFHSVIGVITLPNDSSVRLHEKFGFKKAGHFTEVGFKFKQWMDVGFWELQLNDKVPLTQSQQ